MEQEHPVSGSEESQEALSASEVECIRIVHSRDEPVSMTSAKLAAMFGL